MTPDEARQNPGTVMKDMDLDKQLVLSRIIRKVLCMQMKVDVEWLKRNDIMDYSLLLGISYDKERGYDRNDVHFLDKEKIKEYMKTLESVDGLLAINLGGYPSTSSNKTTQQNLIPIPRDQEKIKKVQEQSIIPISDLSGRGSSEQERHGNKPKSLSLSDDMTSSGSRWQEVSGTNGQVYSFGIIDMLQTYTVQKQMERTLKMIKAAGYNSAGISSMNSNRYADRFINYMFKVLIADEVMESDEI